MENYKKTDSNSAWEKTRTFFYSARFGLIIGLGGLLASFVMFYIQEKEGNRQLETIKDISGDLSFVQNSLTTRYLGEFPDFVDEIDKLLESYDLESASAKDTVIIFEDVLYYGILSKPDGFKSINRKLFQMADSGAHITIAHYNVRGLPFNKIIEQDYIASPEYSLMLEDIAQHFENSKKTKGAGGAHKQVDDIMQHYFDLSAKNHPQVVLKKLDRYKALCLHSAESPLWTPADKDVNDMGVDIENVFSDYLKDYPGLNPSLMNIKKMYAELTNVISAYYRKHNIEIIPVTEYFTMSCWMLNRKAVIGFPSKYGSKEIAFISSDKAFYDYIKAILRGISGQG